MKIITTELPPLGRIIQALLQPFPLLILVDMEIKLQNSRVLFREYPLEIVDLPVPMIPDLLGNEFVNSLDENALVVAPVEDRKFSLPRHLLVFSPQETMIELFGSRFFEVGDPDSLGVYSLKDSVYDSILAASIH